MLLVKTYIDHSKIPNAGIGCFAAEFIPKGTKIWRLNPLFDKIYTQENLSKMDKLEYDFVITYSYKYDGMYYLCVDNARFFNHSDSPNTYDPITESSSTYAAKDIEIGEEILSDYSTFGINEFDNRDNLWFKSY